MMTLAISPETVAQRQEIECLKREFLRLYTKRDRMLNEERDDLYIRYVNLIGKDKYDNFRLSVEVRALKMKTEMAQAAINRNQRPNVYDIQRSVDSQLKDYYESVRQQAEAIKQAQESIAVISAYDSEELHDLFRMLVKRLHPDLHPDQPEKKKDLFLQGQTAYRTHNLTLLREIIMRLDIDGDIDDLLCREESMAQTIERLRQQTTDMQREIDRLNASFPFNLRAQLLDPTWVHEQQEEMKRESEQLEAQKKMYEERFSLMTE